MKNKIIFSCLLCIIPFILVLEIWSKNREDKGSFISQIGITNTIPKKPIENGMAVHITVVYIDQPGQIHTLLGNFAPAAGKIVRMREKIDNNDDNEEYSGMTNQNGLTILIINNPKIDINGHTQKVNISIDGYSENILCDFNAYYEGYYSKEIFIDSNKIQTYFPK